MVLPVADNGQARKRDPWRTWKSDRERYSYWLLLKKPKTIFQREEGKSRGIAVSYRGSRPWRQKEESRKKDNGKLKE